METKSAKVLFFTALFISIEGLSANGGFSSLTLQPDYYWRDYIGDIPKDALIGGSSATGKATYIGQALGYKGNNYGSIPTEITPGSKNLILPLKGGTKSDLDMKVLCSSSRGFKWITTTAHSFESDTWNLRLVKGGTEVNIPTDNRMTLFVGRIRWNGQTIVGKIVTNSSDYERGYSPFYGIINGVESGTFENFDFLAFDP